MVVPTLPSFAATLASVAACMRSLLTALLLQLNACHVVSAGEISAYMVRD